MNLKKRAAGYFRSYPTAKEFHFTSDGLAFFEDHSAESHAKTLPDQDITLIKRDEVEGIDPDEEETEQTQGSEGSTEARKTPATGKAPAKKATPTK